MTDETELRRQWFRMKLASERQMIDAYRALKDPAKASFTLLDTRARADFDKGRIPGALSFPLEELEALAPTLDKGREYVAYCYHET